MPTDSPEALAVVPELVLIVTAGPHAGERHELAGHTTYTIGRQPGLAVSLPSDSGVSRVHCQLTIIPPCVRVVDLGSTGGTHVGEKRIESCEINDGTEVFLGIATAFRVHLPAPSEALTKTYTGTHSGPPGGRPAVDLAWPAIPGFVVDAELGRGAMGVVYRATRAAEGGAGETVALKTILPTIAAARTTIGRFCREADVLAQLHHPHIVGYLGSGAVGGLLFVVMEFVPGVSAATVLAREGTLAPARARLWADQLLAALNHAHEAGFVHRDVKPGNLLVCPGPGRETIKLADFGLARAYDTSGLSGLTAENTAGGSPAYMPPEQVIDFRTAGAGADQYSAAATLHYLLTGSHIYESAPTLNDALAKILKEDPIPRRPTAPPLPHPFGPVIRRALARRPEDRFPSAAAMRVALLGN